MFVTPKKSGLVVLVTALLSACGPVQFSSKKSVDTSGTPTPTPTELREVNQTSSVMAKSQLLDIILIVDDSNSMLADNKKLAAKLSGFVDKIKASSVDWQMCVTSTRALNVNGTAKWGASFYWQNYTPASGVPGYILKSGTANLANIFTTTIDYIGAGWAGSDDERAIKAAYNHVYNGDYHYSSSGCYRPNAAITFIIISDEDERSIGGDLTQKYYSHEGLALEDQDKPDVFVAYVKETLGTDKRFTVNSIIVKPGDATCLASQDSGGSKSHYGVQYSNLSGLTGGGVASICENDFSTNLNLFFDRIAESLSSLPLECTPVGNVTVTITPSMGPVSTRVEGMNLIFSTAVSEGHTIDVKYQCNASDRAPSSVGESQSYQELSLFAKIVNFFKNLF